MSQSPRRFISCSRAVRTLLFWSASTGHCGHTTSPSPDALYASRAASLRSPRYADQCGLFGCEGHGSSRCGFDWTHRSARGASRGARALGPCRPVTHGESARWLDPGLLLQRVCERVIGVRVQVERCASSQAQQRHRGELQPAHPRDARREAGSRESGVGRYRARRWRAPLHSSAVVTPHPPSAGASAVPSASFFPHFVTSSLVDFGVS